MALPLLSLLACIPSQALATAVLGQSLQSLSILSNSYATTGASSTIFGSLMAGDVGTSGAGGYISGNFTTVGAATIGAGGSTVGGNITAGGAMTTGDSAVVGGNITAGGAATVGASSVVSGNVAAAGAVSTGAASQVAGNIASGGAASIGTGALVGGTVAAVGAVTQGVGSSVPSQTVIVTPPVDAGVLVAGLADQAASNRLQVLAAQAAFARMVTTDFLGATITADTTLFSGVYGAASLTTTAGTTITLDGQNRTGQFWVFNIGDILSTGELSRVVLINGATADSVVWNSGGYASLGADSLFVGTLVASASISVGANAAATDTGSSCGGLFSALSFISVGAGARIGSNGCSGVAKGFQIDGNGMAYHEAPAPTDIAPAPEPSTWALLVLGFGLVGLSLRRKPFPVIAA
jgi:cytoskeletal protein CcmA (bactofilin family)